MEMEQLLNMGFPSDLAAEALTATGGTSALKATDWILNRTSSTTASPSPPTATSQPKLDRFFLSQSPNPQSQEQQQQLPKRRKLLVPETPPPPAITSDKPVTSTAASNHHQPLSERMRPRTLNDVVGQDHLLSPNSLLRSAIKCGRLPSLVFWGPPGTGKTSIAKALLNSASSASAAKPYRFVSLSAVTAGVKDVRDVIDEARKRKKLNGQRTVLFVDEVHRFNKSQQDSFLPVIEDGSIVFMGATTENPSFHLITPLLSRSRVLDLRPLCPENIELLLRRAAENSEIGLYVSVGMQVGVNEEAIRFISGNCEGDARVALNALEISATTAAARALPTPDSVAGVTLEDAKEAMQCKHVASDKAGEEHYNLISALHKSMRGSDANAAIYWLSRMVEGGQEPLYIARRLVRFASEDVGLADPLALNQAVACYQACHFIGMPECNVVLAQCVAYLALAPKSIAVYKAMNSAAEVVRSSVGQNEGVPLHLRNAPTKLMKDFGYGKGYIYTPDDPSAEQKFLPPSHEGYKFLDWPVSNEADR
ncbi:hypothetical protein ACLB2K_046843 [Fragaria x ananassa]